MANPRNIEREEREKRGKTAEPMFITWDKNDPKGRAIAMQQGAAALSGAEHVVYRSQSGLGADVRHRHGDGDGEMGFRPSWGRTLKARDMISASMEAYDHFGIVRNIIDTMSDFTVQGVGINHPNPRIEKFFQEWFTKVNGPEISEHIAHNLFLAANAPVRRHTAKLKQQDVDNLQKGVAAESPRPPFLLGKREIPWQYTVMNPVQMVVLGGDLVTFIGPDAFTYAVMIPASVLTQLKRPKSKVEVELIKRLPENVQQSIRDGMTYVPLSGNNMRVMHYKRRHWQVWATPMTYPILNDLRMLDKLKRADMRALDGAISHLRVWKLGSLENQMMPTRAALNKLASILAEAGNGDSADIIWGPDLTMQETETQLHKFLGEAKYVPVMSAIYGGYGIPATLIGASASGGTTNNFISLKTLTERLQYVRRVIREFWEYEASLVQQAMSFRQQAAIRFDRMVLTDEAAEKALLIQLIDRDLISAKTIQERFGEDNYIEEARLKQEARKRKSNKMPGKASPFHDANPEIALAKIYAQTGQVTPSQVGLDLEENENGQKTLIEQQNEQEDKQTDMEQQGQQQEMDHEFRTEKLQLKHGVHPGQLQRQAVNKGIMPGAAAPQTKKPAGRKIVGKPPTDTRKGQPGQGRPRNSKDSKQRKKREFRVRTKAAMIGALSWAEDAFKDIAEATTPAYLRSIGKKNMRQLTNEESDVFERFKFSLLANLPIGVRVSPKSLAKVMGKSLAVPVPVLDLLKQTNAAYREKFNQEPSVEKTREFMCRIVALHKGEVDGL